MLTLTSGTRLKIKGESFSSLFILGGITVSDYCQLDRIVMGLRYSGGYSLDYINCGGEDPP